MGDTPTSLRLSEGEVQTLDSMQEILGTWWPKAPTSRSQVLKMALSRGIEALRREILLDAPHLVARMRTALENHLPFPPPVPGLVELQALVGVPTTKLGKAFGFARKRLSQDNAGLIASFQKALPSLPNTRILLHEPLFAWPVDPTHFWRAGGAPPTVEDWILNTEQWDRLGWARIRFYEAGPFVVGLLSFVNMEEHPGCGITMGIEGLVGFLSACLSLDWTRILWIEHRPLSVFGPGFLQAQEFLAVRLHGEGAGAGIPHIANPEWITLPEPRLAELLGVKE